MKFMLKVSRFKSVLKFTADVICGTALLSGIVFGLNYLFITLLGNVSI